MAQGSSGKLVDFVFSARKWTAEKVVWSKSKWVPLLVYSIVFVAFSGMFVLLWVNGKSTPAYWLLGGGAGIMLLSIIYTLREDRHLVFHREPPAIELVGRSWGNDEGQQFQLSGELRLLRPSSTEGRNKNVVLELLTDGDSSLRCFLGFHGFGAWGKNQIERLENLGDTLQSMTDGRLRFVSRDPDAPEDYRDYLKRR